MSSSAKCNFCISYRLGLLVILSMCLSVPFLIIPSTLTITGTVVVLRWHIFSISIFKLLHLLLLLSLLFYSFQVFHINISGRTFTEVWVTSFLRSPEFFLIFWLISTMLDSLHSSNFGLFQSPFQAFEDHSKCANYNWYQHHFHIPQLYQFSSKVQAFVSLCAFFDFHSVVHWRIAKPILQKVFFFVNYHSETWSGLARIRWSVCISKFRREFYTSHSLRGILVCAWTIQQSNFNFRFLAQFSVDHLPHPIMSSLILLLC